MFGWLRKSGDRVDYHTPPQESPGVSRLQALMGVDIRLAELAGIPPWARTEEQWEELDRLLDRRMRLTAQLVPVVPGRAEASIDNHPEPVCGGHGPAGMRCDRPPHDAFERCEENGIGWRSGTKPIDHGWWLDGGAR